MLTKRLVRDAMQRSVVFCPLDATAREAARLLVEYQTHALVVVDQDGEASGVITATDLVKIHNSRLDEVRVEDIASSPVITIPATFTMSQAAQLMLDKGLHQLVVLMAPELRRPVGLLARTHVVRDMLQAAAEAAQGSGPT